MYQFTVGRSKTTLFQVGLLVVTCGQGVSAAEQDWLINQELKPVEAESNAEGGDQPSAEASGEGDQAEPGTTATAKAAVNQALEPLTPEAVYAQIKRNHQAYQENILEHWPELVISDMNQWVTYRDHYRVRRWVDYQQNEIRISLRHDRDSASLTDNRETVQQELKLLLSTRFKQAIAEDPLLKSLEQLVNKALQESWVDGLVLGELLPKDHGQPAVEALAQQLMSKAELRFTQHPTSGHTLVEVPLSSATTYHIPMPKGRLLAKAKQLQPHISMYAEQLGVPEDLIFAVIHTESHFNPLARSKALAYGLMQVVPHTAGQDATAFLFQEPVLLTPIDLFQPQKNIQIGTAYLSLLYSHYLQEIEDPVSRWYCSVAAYNAGVGNVARAFVKAPQADLAIERINTLSSEQVLDILLAALPADETRQYLKKVMARRVLYNPV